MSYDLSLSMSGTEKHRAAAPWELGKTHDDDDWCGRWRPALGAWVEGKGTRFRVWAPTSTFVTVVLEEDERELALERYHDGTWGGCFEGIRVGQRYWYRIDQGKFPDPA